MRHEELDGSGIYRHDRLDNLASKFADDTGDVPIYAESVWDDVAINVSQVSLPAASAAEWVTWKTTLRALRFQNAGGEYAHITMQLPHSYKDGGQVKFHTHFCHAGTAATSSTVVWNLNYTFAGIYEKWPVEVMATSVYTATATVATDTHCISTGKAITGTDIGQSAVFIGRLSRSASDTYAGNVYLQSVDFHFEKDRPGSDDELPSGL